MDLFEGLALPAEFFAQVRFAGLSLLELCTKIVIACSRYFLTRPVLRYWGVTST